MTPDPKDYFAEGCYLCRRENGEFVVDQILKPWRNTWMAELPEGATVIDSLAFFHAAHRAVIIPDGVHTIRSEAFCNCQWLLYIYIPKSVKVVEENFVTVCPSVTIFCEDAPAEGWVQESYDYVEHFDPEAFNFHRSSGSWDDGPPRDIVHHITKNFNAANRPIRTGITKEEFFRSTGYKASSWKIE